MAESNQHASSYAGDPAHMPDGYLASVGSLKANSGLLGQNPGNPTARQDIPGSQELSVKEAYTFQSPGEPGFLGQDSDDYHGGNMTDNQRPSVPSPEFSGESGTTNMGPQGESLDWNSVAPYKYPEFPKDSYTAGKGASIANPAPLT